MISNFYKKIKQTSYPYIIAELGSNHNGDMDLAKKLIISAKKSGADCVKFQSWTKDTIFSKKKYKDNYFLKDDYRNRKDYNLEQIVEKFSISEIQLKKMSNFCKKINIDFASTPFSKKEVNFLVNDLKVKFIKIASMDVNNFPFLEFIAKKNKPIVLSTGLSTLSEIDDAVRTIKKAGNEQIILLHCIAIYPPKDKEVNLNNIDTLKQLYDFPVGFSDHTLGYSIPLAACAKKICIIEKHFTIDKNMFGWDHKISANPDELKIISKESKRIVKSLGSKEIIANESDLRKNEFRRSIVVNKNKSKGSIIKLNDLDFKRPGTGIMPSEIKYVVGRKLSKKLTKDDLIYWKDLI